MKESIRAGLCHLTSTLSPNPPSTRLPPNSQSTRPTERDTDQVLRDGGYAELSGRRVAVLSNPSGVFQDTLHHLVDDALAAGVDIRFVTEE